MRKQFLHSPVETINLECETTENGRYYITPKGDRLKSVTTILGEKLNNEWLEEWRARIGNEQADRIAAKAARRGTAVHALAERYLLNEDNYIQNTMPHYVMAFESIRKVLNNHVNNIYAIEAPVYSKALKTAGRVDVVAEYDGIRSIIDFKTSSKIKSEEQIYSYFIQTTCYSMMFERMYNLSVPQIVIIMTIDNEPIAKIFNKSRNQYVKDVLDIFA
jgi:hypothetical protein